MAASFDTTTTPILDFGYYRPSQYIERKRIAFPAYAYRVLCPIPTGERLNPFQRAVLHFVSIGVIETAKMAENLRLHPDLMALVSTELQGMGLLKDTGQLTPKGQQAINEDDGLNYQLQTAYVFQNVWTGSLLPRVKSHLEYAEVEYDEKGKPLVREGSHGDPEQYSPYFLYAPDASYEPIDSETILRVVQQHQRHSKANEDSHFSNEIDIDIDDIVSLPVEMDRVQSISQSPTAVYLLTWLYFLEDTLEDGWYVSDPFGLGIAPWLYQAIQVRRQNDNALHKWLESFEIKHRKDADSVKYKDDVALITEDTLIEIFGPQILEHPYYDRLFQFEYRLHEIRQTQQGSYEDLIVQLAKIIEQALRDMQSASCQTIAYPNVDRAFRQQQLDQCAERIGLTLPVPGYYANISPYKVNNAVRKAQGTIAELLIALLLGAIQNEEHPLRHITEIDPGFLVNLAQLAQDRNKSAHASDKQFDMETVESHRQHVFKFLNVLLTTQGTPHVET